MSSEGTEKDKQDEVDPHDENPTFMRLTPPRCSSGMLRGIGISNEEDCISSTECKDGSGDDVNVIEDNMFYEVCAMDDEDTPDVLRKDLHTALDMLSYSFRDHPTLPSDPSDAVKAFPSCTSNEAALLLFLSIAHSKIVRGVAQTPHLT